MKSDKNHAIIRTKSFCELAEARRLQALKENNMEAYVALVQETKNSRLKYLLSQTDEYISIINRLVKDQRSTGKKRRGRKKKKRPVAATGLQVDGSLLSEAPVINAGTVWC
jgi:pentose-5-phosphate-3-epimerase